MPGSAKQSATGLAEGSDIGLGSRGRAFESLYSDQMNEPLFSNIFIEKRGFSTWKALRYKGFLSLHLINTPAKTPNVKLLLNETRFLNDFFEKRVSSFGKALQGQVFPIIHFGEDISKLQKRNSKMCEVPKHVSAFGCKQSDSEL